jgi:hypothetical protein
VKGGQANFSFHVQPIGQNARSSFNYSDPVAGIGLEAMTITSFTITGNHAQFSGTARISRRRNVTFTVNVLDFIGCPDHFSIQMSNGYSAAGDVFNGDTSIHN